MKMPWACFICGSAHHDCGHREPDLVEHFIGKAACVAEQVRVAQQRLWTLDYRARRTERRLEAATAAESARPAA